MAPSEELITTITKRFGFGTYIIYSALVDNLACRRRHRTGTEFAEILSALPRLATAVSKGSDKPPRLRH